MHNIHKDKLNPRDSMTKTIYLDFENEKTLADSLLKFMNINSKEFQGFLSRLTIGNSLDEFEERKIIYNKFMGDGFIQKSDIEVSVFHLTSLIPGDDISILKTGLLSLNECENTVWNSLKKLNDRKNFLNIEDLKIAAKDNVRYNNKMVVESLVTKGPYGYLFGDVVNYKSCLSIDHNYLEMPEIVSDIFKAGKETGIKGVEKLENLFKKTSKPYIVKFIHKVPSKYISYAIQYFYFRIIRKLNVSESLWRANTCVMANGSIETNRIIYCRKKE